MLQLQHPTPPASKHRTRIAPLASSPRADNRAQGTVSGVARHGVRSGQGDTEQARSEDCAPEIVTGVLLVASPTRLPPKPTALATAKIIRTVRQRVLTYSARWLIPLAGWLREVAYGNRAKRAAMLGSRVSLGGFLVGVVHSIHLVHPNNATSDRTSALSEASRQVGGATAHTAVLGRPPAPAPRRFRPPS